MQYTVVVEASNEDGTIWQALEPAENIDTAAWGDKPWTAEEVAAVTASDQNIADGENWRVRVWEGQDADTGTEPAAEHYE